MTGWLGYNQEESGDEKAFRQNRISKVLILWHVGLEHLLRLPSYAELNLIWIFRGRLQAYSEKTQFLNDSVRRRTKFRTDR